MRTPSRRRPLRRLFRFLLLLALLLACCHVLMPQHVTVQAPAAAPANSTPSLPWQLTLVNRWNGLPETRSFWLKTTADGEKVDRRIAGTLNDMLNDAEAQGYEVHLNAGFRTSAEQQALFDDKVAAFCAGGYDDATANELAGQWVSRPGTSEHELGLAVDIGTETPALYDWLQDNSWRYGFIQRYPENKTSLTGVAHEPWHYRYVGEEAAAEMYAQGLCLEEYIDQYNG